MKLLCVLTIILCCLSWTNSQAQTREVFPTKNARWEVLVPAPDYDPPLKGTERGEAYLTYTVGTDSIIGSNGLKYYDLLVDSLYTGSLRTEGEKVWITFDHGDHETLLYDFGVKVGDIIKQENTQYFFETPFYKEYFNSRSIWFSWEQPIDLKVTKVKNGIYGKEFEILDNSYYPDIWYEGIGSLYGIFLGKAWLTSGNPYRGGGCLWKQEINGVRHYPEQDYGDIRNQIGPAEIHQIHSDKPCISYNPATKILQITIEEMDDTNRLEIYSADGTCILRKDLYNRENSISLSFLLSGTYLCKLSKNHQTITTQKIRL